jgi:hypothetical protein
LLDAAAITVTRPEKNKKGKKAIPNTQASPQHPDEETMCKIGQRALS